MYIIYWQRLVVAKTHRRGAALWAPRARVRWWVIVRGRTVRDVGCVAASLASVKVL